MSIQRLQTDHRMSQIVIHDDTVYLSGQVDLESPAKTAEEQTMRILGRIDQLLAQAGSSKSSLLSATIWLSDVGDFAQMNRAWSAWLPPGCAPAP
jgi:enamine deaminase RidA (YjgF/YER057c/UK114 family)